MSNTEQIQSLIKSLNECRSIDNIEKLVRDFSQIEPSLIEIFSQLTNLKLENIELKLQLEKNLEFHNAMKNIAKIIETQYELHYIIPIIGEILDTFISNHLIYIYLKTNGKMKLVYPTSCLDKKITEKIKTINTESEYQLNKNKTTGYFPMVSENHLVGCIVTKSTEGELSEQEIDFMLQLTKQVAITTTRASVYADILKHATLDALTGFYNRRQLEERLKQEVSSAKRNHSPLCVIMTDIDFFKKVNDTYGHAAGDLVLKTAARIMRSHLREYDIAARYGGEEFVIILPHTTKTEAIVVAERLRSTIEKKVIDIGKVNTKDETKSISITISLGVYDFKSGDKAEDLLMKVDKVLYEAKETGRNKTVTA